MFSNIEKIKFHIELNESSQNICTLLKNLLQFNPNFRSQAEDLVSLSIFDEVRDVKLEQAADFKIELEVDSEDSFDYSLGESRTLTLEDIK